MRFCWIWRHLVVNKVKFEVRYQNNLRRNDQLIAIEVIKMKATIYCVLDSFFYLL